METIGAILGLIGFLATVIIGVAFIFRTTKLITWRWANWRVLLISIVLLGIGAGLTSLANLQYRHNTLVTIQNNMQELQMLSGQPMPELSGELPIDALTLEHCAEIRFFKSGCSIEFTSTLEIEPQADFLCSRLRLVHEIVAAMTEYQPAAGAELESAERTFYQTFSSGISKHFSTNTIAVTASGFNILHGESIDWTQLGDLCNSSISEYVTRISPMVKRLSER